MMLYAFSSIRFTYKIFRRQFFKYSQVVFEKQPNKQPKKADSHEVDMDENRR